MILVGLGLPILMIFLPALSVIGAVRCWRLGLEHSGGHLIVRRIFSTDVVPLDTVVSASFGKPFSPGFPTALMLDLSDGRSLKVRGVSTKNDVLPIPPTTVDRATTRVAEFLERARAKQ